MSNLITFIVSISAFVTGIILLSTSLRNAKHAERELRNAKLIREACDDVVRSVPRYREPAIAFEIEENIGHYTVVGLYRTFNIMMRIRRVVIKRFPFADDREYARLCAEELIDALNAD